MRNDPASVYLPAVDFTPADVMANRRGELSPDQQIRLDEIAAGRHRGAVATTKWLALFVGLLLVVGFVIEAGNDEAPGAGGALIALGTMGVVLAVAITASYLLNGSVRTGRVSVAEGVVEPVVAEGRTRYRGTYTRYELHLKGGRGRDEFLLVDRASLDRFPAGQRCRVYFIDQRPFPIVLSGEAIEHTTPGWGGPDHGR